MVLDSAYNTIDKVHVLSLGVAGPRLTVGPFRTNAGCRELRKAMFRKWILVTIGTIAIGLGVIGIFVPLLPTTPFLLLAAACFARSSESLYTWLVGYKWFGDYIRHYHEHTHNDEHTHPHAANGKKSVTPWVLFIIFIFGPCEQRDEIRRFQPMARREIRFT